MYRAMNIEMNSEIQSRSLGLYEWKELHQWSLLFCVPDTPKVHVFAIAFEIFENLTCKLSYFTFDFPRYFMLMAQTLKNASLVDHI